MGVFRLYSWDKPSFSFGVSQRVSRAVNLDFVKQHNYAYVRRLTGGKTVMHHHEITYSVMSSEDIFYKDNDLYRSYLLISQVLAKAFNRLGIDAYLSQGSPSHLSKSNNPCFSFPTPNEIEIAGKKIIGSVQKRNNKALLQHGSIPLSMDYHLYAGGTHTTAENLQRRMTTFSDVSDKNAGELTDSLVACFQDFVGVPLKEFQFDTKDIQAIGEIAEKYASDHWNCRV